MVVIPATPQQVRACFDSAIANTTDPQQIARLEVCREYLTNPAFRSSLEATTFELCEQIIAKEERRR
jgi:hypothetical protein